ncbi:HAD family hydrolase [Salinirubrum litoreum]|uniref:HAD family hydrolase n=1 Tax=Salinirubrum litoreum TaxID=1126234 RepID=A0ABD5RDR5_9EURY
MRAICLDLDGTLLQFDREYADLLRNAVADGLDDPERADLAGYDAAFFEAFEDHEPNPVRRGFEAAVPDATDDELDALADALLRHEADACSPPAGAAYDLARLREEYLLGVVTNGVGDWQRQKLAASGLDQYFDTVVVSYEVGAHKPDTAAFEAVEERLAADEFAMVGDAEADVAGGESAGWATYRYEGERIADLPDAIDWG